MTTVDAFPEVRVAPEDDPNKRYTTRETMQMIMKICRVHSWDLDVAADEESHWAEPWYGIEQDGLIQPWFGAVFCNPPFDNVGDWVRRAWIATTTGPNEINAAKSVAMLLPANRTEQPWWQTLVEPFRDRGFDTYSEEEAFAWHDSDQAVRQTRRTDLFRPTRLRTHFLPGRTRYGHPGNKDAVGVDSPPFASVLLVWR